MIDDKLVEELSSRYSVDENCLRYALEMCVSESADDTHNMAYCLLHNEISYDAGNVTIGFGTVVGLMQAVYDYAKQDNACAF